MGNKVDIEPPEIDVTTSKSFAAAHEFELSYLVSCKTNDGITDAFEALAKALHSSPSGGQQRTKSVIPGDALSLDSERNQDEGGGCRC